MKVQSQGKCLRCNKVISSVKAGHVVIDVSGGTARNGLAYSCPNCDTLISIEMDPIAVKHDIVRDVKKAIAES
jgi:hypothetical protein